MKKLNIFIIVFLAFFSAVSQAEQALTKELVTSFEGMSKKWKTIEANYPELSQTFEKLDLTQSDKIISMVKNSAAYPKIKSMLNDHNFETIEEFHNITMRLMGGIMSYQIKNLPEGQNIESMALMLKQSIQQMKSSNVPASMIAEMETQLVNMEKNMVFIKEAVKNTSAADMKFINENAAWIMSVLDNG